MDWFWKKECKIDYAQISYPGDRDYNEDSIAAGKKEKEYLFVLADGLGGCGHGELASGTAVNAVMEVFESEETDDEFQNIAFDIAQEKVFEKQQEVPEAKTMATTLVVLKIHEKYASWAHIGDSRLYWFRDGKVMHQTLDHSVPQMLVRMGEITSDEIRYHPDRSRLLNIIGREYEEKKYEVAEPVKIKSGDAFLLCSDGFWEYIIEDCMCEMLSESADAQEWLNLMTEEVEMNGQGKNMDNYSAICVRVI